MSGHRRCGVGSTSDVGHHTRIGIEQETCPTHTGVLVSPWVAPSVNVVDQALSDHWSFSPPHKSSYGSSNSSNRTYSISSSSSDCLGTMSSFSHLTCLLSQNKPPKYSLTVASNSNTHAQNQCPPPPPSSFLSINATHTSQCPPSFSSSTKATSIRHAQTYTTKVTTFFFYKSKLVQPSKAQRLLVVLSTFLPATDRC